MLAFKDITPSDKGTIQSFTLNHWRRNCDLSFSNLCSWRFLYGTQFTVANGFLVLRFRADGKLAYMMPVGKGDPTETLQAIMADAQALGEPFLMTGVCADTKDELERSMPGVFEFTTDRDYADYIYLREDLATLKGKKYQPKRNHINKFLRTYPGYDYTPITTDRIAECLQLEMQWCKANNCKEQEALSAERQSLTYALNHFDELGLLGGILHADGRIAAFTFGTPINAQTFDVCIEKADTDIDGAYTMINYEFARHIPEQYLYLNREEDLGIEGLRKAKLSYHPCLLLEKYTATLRK